MSHIGWNQTGKRHPDLVFYIPEKDCILLLQAHLTFCSKGIVGEPEKFNQCFIVDTVVEEMIKKGSLIALGEL